MQTFRANLKALTDVRVLTDAAQISVGSIGAPIIAGFLVKAVQPIVKTQIDLGKPLGKVLIATGGAILATGVTAATGKSAFGKNVIYGTVAGIMSDFAKQFIVPLIPGAVPAAPPAPAATVTAPETATAPAGVTGVREDVYADAMGLGAYATVSEIQRAAEEF